MSFNRINSLFTACLLCFTGTAFAEEVTITFNTDSPTRTITVTYDTDTAQGISFTNQDISSPPSLDANNAAYNGTVYNFGDSIYRDISNVGELKVVTGEEVITFDDFEITIVDDNEGGHHLYIFTETNFSPLCPATGPVCNYHYVSSLEHNFFLTIDLSEGYSNGAYLPQLSLPTELSEFTESSDNTLEFYAGTYFYDNFTCEYTLYFRCQESLTNQPVMLESVLSTPTMTPPAAPMFHSELFAKPDAVIGQAYTETLSADATDANGDDMTFSLVNGPDWLTVDPDGTLSGTPTSSHQGSNMFEVRVTDTGGDFGLATMTIEVTDAAPPIFTDTPLIKPAAVFNSTYEASLAGDATDSNGDMITFSKVSGPDWLTVAEDGSLSGTPLLADVGSNEFVVSASDGTLSSETSLTIQVQGHGLPFQEGKKYRIKALSHGQDICLDGNAANSLSRPNMNVCRNFGSQQWQVVPVGENQFLLKAKSNNGTYKCLSNFNQFGNIYYTKMIACNEYNPQPDSIWALGKNNQRNGRLFFKLKTLEDVCLISKATAANSGAIPGEYVGNHSVNSVCSKEYFSRYFTFEEYDSIKPLKGKSIIRNIRWKKNLDVYGGSKKNGANISAHKPHGAPNQQFHIKYLNNGRYSIKNAKSGKCMSSGWKAGHRTNVYQYSCNERVSPHQWYLLKQWDGQYQIRSARNRHALLRVGGSHNNYNIYLTIDNQRVTWTNRYYMYDIKSLEKPKPKDLPICTDYRWGDYDKRVRGGCIVRM